MPRTTRSQATAAPASSVDVVDVDAGSSSQAPNPFDFPDTDVPLATPKNKLKNTYKRAGRTPKTSPRSSVVAVASEEEDEDDDVSLAAKYPVAAAAVAARKQKEKGNDGGGRNDSAYSSQDVSPRKLPKHSVEVVVAESHRAAADNDGEIEEEYSEDENDEDEDEDEDSDDESDEDTTYAEKILDERSRKGEKQYLIKWEGLPHDANEWVIAAEVDVLLIQDWETKTGKGKKKVTLKRDETYMDGDEMAWMVDEEEEGGKKRRRKSGGSGGSPKRKKKSGSDVEEGEGDEDGGEEDGSPVKKTKSPRKKKASGDGGGSTKAPSKRKLAAPKVKKLSKKAQLAAEREAERQSRIAALAGKDVPTYTGYDHDPTHPHTPDTSCCLLCSAREFNRAVATGDYTLLQSCVEETKRMCAYVYGRKPDLPHDTALRNAILRNDLRAVKVLKESLSQSRVGAPEQYMKTASTGYVGARTFGHRIKTVNESRGNREGNNAFYNYTSVDPFTDYTAPPISGNTRLRLAPGGNSDLHRTLEHCLRDPRFTKEMIEYLIMEWPGVKEVLGDFGVYELCASGNVELARVVVEILGSGFGFNGLHEEALKLKSGETLGSFRKPSVLKKATGNGGITPLEMAAINPDTTALAELYDALSAPETTEPDNFGRQPVHFAAGCRETAPLEWLIAKGVDVKVGDAFKFIPLQLAAKYGRHKNVPILVAAMGVGADYTLMKDGYTALHFAAHYGHEEVVKALLEAGANASQLDKKLKSTPLHHAARMGHLACVEVLLDHPGVDMDAVDKMGRTPMTLAAKSGHFDIVRLLLERGADAEKGDSSDNRPLHYAAGYGWPSIVDLLVIYGNAELNSTNNWKFTPLMVADLKGHMKIVNQLLSKADIQANFRDKDGLTLLHYCAQALPTTRYDAERLVQKTRTLVGRGADPKVGNLEEKTALHLLCEQVGKVAERPGGRKGKGKEVANGGDVGDGQQQQQEVEEGFWQDDLVELRVEIGKILLEHGATPNQRDKSGETPFDVAMRFNSHDLVILFLNHGVDVSTNGFQLIKYLGTLALEADAHIHDYETTDSWPRIYDGGIKGQQKALEKKADFARVWEVVDRVVGVSIKDMVAQYNDDGYTALLQVVKDAVEKQKTASYQKVTNIKNNQYYYGQAVKPAQPAEITVEYQWDTLIEFLKHVIAHAGADTALNATVKLPKNVLESLSTPNKLPEPAEVGYSMLHFVADSRCYALVQFLCSNGANVNILGGKSPVSALYLALDKPSDLEVPVATQNSTAFVKYVSKPYDECWESTLSALLTQEANVDELIDRGDDGMETPLLKAVRIAPAPPSRDAQAEATPQDADTATRWNFASRRIVRAMIAKTSGEAVNISLKDGLTPVMHFITRRDLEMVRRVVEKNADLSRIAKSGMGVAHLAVSAVGTQDEVLEMVKCVVDSDKERSAPLAVQNADGDTALMIAARAGLRDVAMYLIECARAQGTLGEIVNLVNKRKGTVLMIAAYKGDENILNEVIRGGADVSMKGAEGTDALLWAVKAKSKECVEILVRAGAQVNVKDESGMWAIHYAVQNDDPKCVKALLEAGADPSSTEKHGLTPMHLAVQASKHAINTSLRIERLLVQHHAPINALDYQGRSALHITFIDTGLIPRMHIATEEKKRHERYQKRLDAEGRAEKRRKQIEERWKAVDGGRDEELERWLAAPEVEIERKKREGELKEVMDIMDERSDEAQWHTGKWEGHEEVGKVKGDPIEVLSWLVELPGIELDLADKFGRTPLHYAGRMGAFTCSSYLLERGAGIDAVDRDENTPLQVALLYRHIDYAVMLANRGAEVMRDITQAEGTKLSIFKYSLMHKFMSLAYIIMEKGQELMNAVHDALCTGKYHLAVLLISKSSREVLHRRDPVSQQSLVHIAADFPPSDRIAWEEYSLEIADLLLGAGLEAEITRPDAHGRTPLHYAAKYGQTAFVKWMLERSKAEDYKVDGEGVSVVGYALTSKVVETITAVLDAGLDVTSDDAGRNVSVVRRAVETGNKEIVKTVLERGASPNLDVGLRTTALGSAIRRGHFAIVISLIKRGANVNDESMLKVTDKGEERKVLVAPLFEALGKTVKSDKGRSNLLIERLLAAGAKPDPIHPESKQTPLHMALASNNLAEIKSLVDHGADVNLVEPQKKRSAFQIAFFAQRTNVLELLGKGKPDVDQHDNVTGLTLIDYAVEQGDLDLLKQVLGMGADANVRSLHEVNPKQLTTLMKCAISNSVQAFRMILNHTIPVDVNATDINGQTVLHHIVTPRETASFENVELLKLVVEKGADLQRADMDGQRPIDCAWKQWSKKMYKALLELGARDVESKEALVVDRMDIEEEGATAVPDIDINNDADRGREEILAEEAGKELRQRQRLAATRKMTLEQLDEEDKLKAVPVDPNIGWKSDVANVLRETNEDGEEDVYDMLMTKTDVEKGMYGVNMFYKFQVVYHRLQELYVLWTRWGAVGEIGMFQKTPYNTKEECVQEFEKIFKSKTGNAWKDRGTDTFIPKPGKYIPQRIVARKNVAVKPLDGELLLKAPKSNLPSPVQDFMKIITNVPTFNRAINEADVGLPLGNLEPKVVKQAYDVLLEIRDKVKELDEENKKTLVPDVNAIKTLKYTLVDLSNKYYSLVPAKHDARSGIQPILRLDKLNEEMVKMTSLMYLDSGSNLLLAAYARRTTLNPLDYIAHGLSCTLTPVPSSSHPDEFALIDEFIRPTSEPAGGNDFRENYDIVSLFRADRAGEVERFADFKETEGRKLLWHGSRLSNFMGILRQGLRVAPIEAPVTGYMFGKGIYFADTFAKSIGYAYSNMANSGTDAYACLLLCEVAVGKPYEREDAEYMEKAPDGFDSTKGLGQWEPSGEVVLCEDGVQVPRYPMVRSRLRKGDNGRDKERYLQHNEYIVYNAAQVRIRYVVLVRNRSQCFLCNHRKSVQHVSEYAKRYGPANDEEKKTGTDEEKFGVGKLPNAVLEGNTFEQAIAKGALFAMKKTVRRVWEENVEKVVEEKSYLKRWQPVTSLTMQSPICGDCADLMLSDMLYDVVKSGREDGTLPGPLVNRPDCWWGSNCRTQRLEEHAKKYNHICPQTKKVEEEKEVEDTVDDEEEDEDDYSDDDGSDDGSDDD
ncbi:hypothetical protein HDV00_001875 [Rhizophlyctis rosea]|nr:hypothetical protein HDV00_001875 [Rhizophlyctis rosea]